MRALPEGSLLYVGLRADEKQRGGIYGDYVTSIYPMQQWGWGIDDVRQYLIRRGIDVPKRTDCGVCFYQRLSEWYSLWKDYPEYYQQGVDVEVASGYTFRSPGRDTWPASLAELREEFKAGRVPRGVHLNRDLFGDEQPICRACSL